MSETRERIKKILATDLNVDESQISGSSRIVEDLNADSLASAEIVISLEEAFDIEIPDEKASSIKTFDDAVKCVEELISKAS